MYRVVTGWLLKTRSWRKATDRVASLATWLQRIKSIDMKHFPLYFSVSLSFTPTFLATGLLRKESFHPLVPSLDYFLLFKEFSVTRYVLCIFFGCEIILSSTGTLFFLNTSGMVTKSGHHNRPLQVILFIIHVRSFTPLNCYYNVLRSFFFQDLKTCFKISKPMNI